MRTTTRLIGSAISGWWDGNGGPEERSMDGDGFGMGIYNDRVGDGGSPGGLLFRTADGDGRSAGETGDGPP